MEIKSSPMLKAVEKETIVRFNKDECIVDTYHRTGVKWVMDNPDAEILDKRTDIIDGEEYLVGIKARVPKGNISLKGTKRTTDTVSGIFTMASKENDF